MAYRNEHVCWEGNLIFKLPWWYLTDWVQKNYNARTTRPHWSFCITGFYGNALFRLWSSGETGSGGTGFKRWQSPWKKFCTKVVEKSPVAGCGWMIHRLCIDLPVDSVEFPMPGRQVHSYYWRMSVLQTWRKLDFSAFERDTLVHGHCKVCMNLSAFLIISLLYSLLAIWCESFFPRVCICFPPKWQFGFYKGVSRRTGSPAGGFPPTETSIV